MLSRLRTALAFSILLASFSNAQAVDRRLLPAGTEMVITINVKQILDNKGLESLQNALKKSGISWEPEAALGQVVELVQQRMPGFDRALALAAFTVDFKDLHSITLAHPGSLDVHTWLVIVEGRFDREKFAAAARLARFFDKGKEGPGLRLNDGDNPLVGCFTLSKTAGKTEAVWFALIDGKALVVSYKEEAVKEAARRVRADLFVAKNVETLLPIANDKQSLSVLMTPDGIQRIVREAEDAKRDPKLDPTPADDLDGVLNGVRSLFAKYGKGLSANLAITLAADFRFEFHVGCPNQEEAEYMKSAFGLISQFARAFATEGPGGTKKPREQAEALLEFVDSLRIEYRPGHFVVLTGRLSWAKIPKAFGQ